MKQDAWEYWYPRKEGTVEPEIPKLAELLTHNYYSKLLDFGCGAGRHVIYFARKGFQVYGFDKSAAAIERAMEALERENLHANLKVWDMTQPLPYEDSFFDVVIATRVMHHTYFESVRRIAQEISRMLQKGGYLFLQVPSYTRTDTRDKKGRWKLKKLEPRTYAHTEGEEKDVPHHHFTKQELLRLFPSFTTLELHRETEHYHGWCWLARKQQQRT